MRNHFSFRDFDNISSRIVSGTLAKMDGVQFDQEN